MEKTILIKYGELTTKKGNRGTFIKLLARNINSILNGLDYKLKYDRVRMYIEAADTNEVVNRLQKIFGIHSIVISYKVNNNIDELHNLLKEILKQEKFNTFKVETNRADKSFPIPSMEFSRQIGGFILKNFSCKVDVHNPEIRVNIEIRNNSFYVSLNEIKGIGGYPVGVQGKSLLMLSGGIDSPVAGYLALKRGIDIDCMYFESPPHTSLEAKNKVLKLASIINAYSGNIRVHVVPFTKLQEEIYKNVRDEYVITIMRRMMYRIASRFVQENHMHAIINGESVGQVASQTLTSMSVINSVTNLPIIRPVACLDKLEIIDIANKIGTYETSILPYEDCCTIFLPKHPVINPEQSKCLFEESKFSFDNLIDECINNIETITITNKEKNELL
ncbi:MAG: tRNA 4-thiouridine(8) synthase ThiI [Bacilli bacterium]|nr:tRNA 4-thiouridine(8) synthase ThiI [Bacilli bacterium]